MFIVVLFLLTKNWKLNVLQLRMDKPTVIYSYNGILFKGAKELFIYAVT